jgi:hypothetical protein
MSPPTLPERSRAGLCSAPDPGPEIDKIKIPEGYGIEQHMRRGSLDPDATR